MKGHRTRATKAGIAAAAEENRRPERKPSSVEVSQLRVPNETEKRLFDVAVLYHDRCDHVERFERCEEPECSETRQVLGITGFLHRFDSPPPVTEDD